MEFLNYIYNTNEETKNGFLAKVVELAEEE